MSSRSLVLLLGALLFAACSPPPQDAGSAEDGAPVASTLTGARAADGRFISWREHLIDDEAIDGVPLCGSDGLDVGGLDRDGHLDVVSVAVFDPVRMTDSEQMPLPVP